MFDIFDKWWGAVVTAMTLVGGLAVGRYRLRKVEERVEQQEATGKRRLYNEDGKPIYVMQTDCQVMTANCRQLQRQEMDEIKSLIKEQRKETRAQYREIQQALMNLVSKS